ncbi:hypothetical protein BV898_06047 [Hypsibius exemplaris]|uniref:Uncharacterized protein n=1 Tax=Hypsibius exemplaris TaxID=2072580 RepID=A0A1W0WXW5_HYPEX|nr:hypothetical protein BV898_06047 [Hypsibius exemplaris]
MYIIPDNFNVTCISPRTVHLEITEGWVRSESLTVLPPRSTLQSVHLERFNLDSAHARFPLDTFFVNVKVHLHTLRLAQVKLLHLTSLDFEGFSSLESLRLSQVQVDVLGHDIFQSLTPDGSLPKLSYLEISRGVTKSFYWSILKPISGSLKHLNLDELMLTVGRWNCSGAAFKLEQTSTISLRNNSLTLIPPCFLNSLSEQALVSLDLETSLHLPASQSVFCSTTNACGCCDMSLLAYWVRGASFPQAVRSITCGKSKTTFYNGSFPGKISYNSNCPKPTTTKRVTSKRPSSTVMTSVDPSTVAPSSDLPEQTWTTQPSTTSTISETTWEIEVTSKPTAALNEDMSTQNSSPPATLTTETYLTSASTSLSPGNTTVTNGATDSDGWTTALISEFTNGSEMKTTLFIETTQSGDGDEQNETSGTSDHGHYIHLIVSLASFSIVFTDLCF